MDAILSLLRELRSWRHHRLFPVAMGLLAALALLYAPLPDKVTWAATSRLPFAIPIAVAVGLLSRYLQRPPQNKEKHIGIVFAIRAENPSIRSRVSSDIISEAKTILEAFQSNQPFHVFELGNDLSELITNNEVADLYRRRSKSHMLIYGEAKQRKERGHMFHVLLLNGLVTHSPLPDEPRSILAQEMAAVMPLRQRIEEENEISGFQITSIQLAQSVQFVIATAALLSHDGFLAVRLLEDLKSKEQQLRKHGNIEAIGRLRHLIPKRLSDAYQFQSSVAFARWEMDRDSQHLQEAFAWLDKREEKQNSHSMDYLLLKAVVDFVIHKNIANAKKWVQLCEARYIVQPAWKYSAAFLNAYEGNLDKALKYYESALLLEQGHHLPFQIEGFIAWTLESEPDRTGLYFCLGYINEKLKGDNASALAHYDRFLGANQNCSVSSIKAVEHARAYVAAHASSLAT